uniref:Fibronectin type-II domain-containing protein n=1 Tax=Oryctolagus cuniculus TaxID=9986 RepID=G1U8W1_RABIT
MEVGFTWSSGADETEIRLPSTEDSQSENNLLRNHQESKVFGFSDNKCVFPFTFGNKKHFDCIDHPLLHSWCSLSEIYNGKWKYCTDDDRARCVFPFTYKGHVFNSCITLGSVFQMSWCSLSPNYDQDHAWKYCY